MVPIIATMISTAMPTVRIIKYSLALSTLCLCSVIAEKCVGSVVCDGNKVCLKSASTCVDCLTKGDCKDPLKPFCDDKNNCVECLTDSTCRSDGNCNAVCSNGQV